MTSLFQILKNKYNLDNNLKDITNYENLDNFTFFDLILNRQLIDFNIISDVLKKYYGIETIDLFLEINDSIALEALPHSFCIKNNILPIKIINNKLYLAMENPFNYHFLKFISDNKYSDIVKVFSHSSDIKVFIDSWYTNSKINNTALKFNFDEQKNKPKQTEQDIFIENAPAVKIVNQIIEMSIFLNASDIHLEPLENCVRVRYRIDGELVTNQEFSKNLAAIIISRIKLISNMNIYEKRLPQEGRFQKVLNNSKIDFRVSSIPTVFEEKIVIRIINNRFDINKIALNLEKSLLDEIYITLKSKQGTILITGPTGSGKSTTLASFIKKINNDNINIVTIEDPVENILYGVNQISINPQNGFDFSDALKFILRQDPDVIMVGEIRDSKTANLAIRASMTGHLVLSTLHTNDSLAAISRLIDMGVQDYLILDNLKIIISQRLIRRLCDSCKAKTIIDSYWAKFLNLHENTEIYKSVGCKFCNNTGFKNRVLISEALKVNSNLKSLFKNKMSLTDMKSILKEQGMKFLVDNAIENLLIGDTTIEEICKVIY